MKKVLITGAKGFIGRHTLAPLKARNFDIHAITSQPLSKIENDLLNQATWYQVNLLNHSEIKEILAKIKPSHFLHFAWDTTYQKYWHSELNFQWVQASLEILRQVYEQGCKRVVFAGTCAEYDENYGYCSELLTPRNPHSIYGICKKSLQEMFEAYCDQYNISGAWGRIFFVYGPYENPNRLIPYVTCSLLQNKPALCSSGDQIRDFLYVEDAANAFVSLLDSDVLGSINISSGQPIQIKEIVQKIAKITNKPELIKLGARTVDNQSQKNNFLIANINKLVSKLSWQQEIDLDSGLNLTVNWWKHN